MRQESGPGWRGVPVAASGPQSSAEGCGAQMQGGRKAEGMMVALFVVAVGGH